MRRDPLGSTTKRVKYTAKRTKVIQTDRCAFKTQNSLLTRQFCSNRLLFGDGDGDDGDDGRSGVVDFFSCGVVELFSSSIMLHAPRAGRIHTIISFLGQIVQTSLSKTNPLTK